MAGFDSINNFGSLTVGGKTLKFEDFDKDKNGEISTEEYNSLLEEVKLDKVELSTIDKNGDNILSTEEFSAWEQKIAMQDAVNAMASQISKDFAGKSQYLAQVKEALKNFIEEFATTYTGEASNLVEAFKEALPNKYETIKKEIFANDPTTIKSKVLDEIYTELIPTNETKGSDAVSGDTAKRIMSELEKEADRFIKSYKGTNLEADLKAHLAKFLEATDSDLMQSAIAKFKAGTDGLGPVYDSNDLTIIKEHAKELLQTAIDNGVAIKLGGTNIKTSAAINSVLRKYNDGQQLMHDIEEAIASLSNTSKYNAIVEEEKVKALEAAEKQFTDIKGSEYAVNPALIDYSRVDARYFQEDGQIYQRGKGWSGSKDKAFQEGFEILTSDALKAQIKAQIETMLKAKGIPFEKIAQVFENVYNQTAQDILNAEGMITGRGARGLSSKGKAYINVKSMCDTFVTTFNTNIAKAIDEMNKSSKDFETLDLNYEEMNADENGNLVAENGEDFAQLYATGKPVTVRKKGADYYIKIANQLIENMKRQMLAKANAMCQANGIEFDKSVFDTMFNNAKLSAIYSAVSGVNTDGTSLDVGKSAASLGITAVGLAGVGTAAAVTAGVSLGTAAGLGVAAVGAEIAAAVPVAGWIVGGALALGGIISSITGGHHSESTLDTKKLMDTFTEQFKANFSNWVETEKNEKDNNK